MKEEDVSTIIPANVLHTGLENTENKVCYLLCILTDIQTEFYILAISLYTYPVTCLNEETFRSNSNCMYALQYTS